MRGESLAISASLYFRPFEDLSMVGFANLGVNLLVTVFLKEMLRSLIGMEFQPDS